MLKYVIAPIHQAGWPFIGLALAATLGLALLWQPLVWPGLAAVFFCIYFFRDPVRMTPVRQGLVVSPADGIVTAIERATPPPELEMEEHPLTRISVFLSVLDVHVNRVPADGTVLKSAYHPGQFLNAAMDKALDGALTDCDATGNRAHWNRIQTIYAEELPILPLYFRTEPYILPKWLKGVRPTGHQYLSSLWVEQWHAAP